MVQDQYSGLTPASPEESAHLDLDLTTEEKNLYKRHLDNLHGSGGVDNPDGSRSSLYATTVGVDDKHYVIPTVREGKILEPHTAVEEAFKEGIDKFPSYASPEEAKDRYDKMHGYMEQDTRRYIEGRDNFRVTDQQRLEDAFKDVKSKIPEEHHGVLKNFWENVLGPTIAQGIINPLMDPTMIMGAGRIKPMVRVPSKLPEIQFPSEVKIAEAKRGSYSGSYEGTETMPQQQQAFLSYGKSPGLDSNKMLKAIGMKDAGASETQIYKKLGAELYEGKWGERVPYSGMEIKVKPDTYPTHDLNPVTQEFTPNGGKMAFYTVEKPTTLSEVVEHTAIFKADPTTKDIKVRSMTKVEQDRYEPHTFGFAEVTNNTIVIRPNLNEETFKQAIVHEVEHIVQAKHGFPQGSSPEMFRDRAYRIAEAQKERSYLELVDRVHQLQYFKGEAKNIPAFTSETVDSLISIAHKGRAKPSALTPEEKTIYQDIKKNGLDKELYALDTASNNVTMMDMQNARNYKVTKGEVGSRAGEAELGKTAEEVSKVSYKKTLDAMVPENRRIDSPLDVGFPQGKKVAEGTTYDFEAAMKAKQAKEAARVAEEKYIQDYRTAKNKLPKEERISQTVAEQIVEENLRTAEGRIEPSRQQIDELVQKHRKNFLDMSSDKYIKNADALKQDLLRLENHVNKGNPNLQTNPSQYEEAVLSQKWKALAEQINKEEAQKGSRLRSLVGRLSKEKFPSNLKGDNENTSQKVSTPEEEEDFKKFIASLSSKVNKDAFEAWLETAPVSKNIEDRTGQTYVPPPGPRVYTFKEAQDLLKKNKKKK